MVFAGFPHDHHDVTMLFDTSMMSHLTSSNLKYARKLHIIYETALGHRRHQQLQATQTLSQSVCQTQSLDQSFQTSHVNTFAPLAEAVTSCCGICI